MRRQDMTRFRNTGMITEVLIGLVREEGQGQDWGWYHQCCRQQCHWQWQQCKDDKTTDVDNAMIWELMTLTRVPLLWTICAIEKPKVFALEARKGGSWGKDNGIVISKTTINNIICYITTLIYLLPFLDPQKTVWSINTSGGTLWRDNCQLIGLSLIVLARQAQKNRN